MLKKHIRNFLHFGLCVAFLGPTILDLRCQTQSTLQEITLVFFSQQFFLFIGSTIGGFFSKTLASSLSALAVSTLLISVVFAVIPLCHKLLLLAFAMAVSGLAMGIIDTISNLQLVKIYQKDSTVFLQTLHFFVGLGALVSPLIADPFLSDTSCVIGNSSVNATSLTHLRHRLAGRHVHNVSSVHLHTEGEVVTNVSYAFWIMAMINLPVPVAIFILMYFERLFSCGSNPNRRLLDGDVLAMKTWGTTGLTEDAGHQKESSRSHIGLFSCCLLGNTNSFPLSFFWIHILGGLVLFFSDGIVGSYTGFVYSYAVAPPMNLPHKTAGHKAPAPSDHLDVAGVTKGCATTVLVTSAGMGEMVLQVIVGSVMHNKGSFSFLLCGMIFGCLGFTFFVLLFFVQQSHKNVTEAFPNNSCTERLEQNGIKERLEQNGIKTCSATVPNSRDMSKREASIDP
ncbi:major facilitator superfamily domain-containing protein 4A [Pimephales promelas]|nr:major facilitator superfamily domain-containing protein 4A [Pimephales promelas]